MRTLGKVAPILWILVCAASTAAQPFWEKKPHSQWSKGECQKLLGDSPWARKFVISTVQADRFGQSTGGEARQTEQKITYTVQFRSVEPVRQAVVRLLQHQNKYDKMKPEEQKLFDQSAAAYLEADPGNRVVVHVTFDSNVQFYAMELVRFWHSYPSGTMPRDVWFTTSSGKRVEAYGWKVAPGGAQEFEFYFPREVDGEPLILPTDKKVWVEFPNPRLRDLDDTRARFEFSVEKMKYKGEVAF